MFAGIANLCTWQSLSASIQKCLCASCWPELLFYLAINVRAAVKWYEHLEFHFRVLVKRNKLPCWVVFITTVQLSILFIFSILSLNRSGTRFSISRIFSAHLRHKAFGSWHYFLILCFNCTSILYFFVPKLAGSFPAAALWRLLPILIKPVTDKFGCQVVYMD